MVTPSGFLTSRGMLEGSRSYPTMIPAVAINDS
jgi:hypothetical protein